MWTHRFAPAKVDDLCLHKNKVTELENLLLGESNSRLNAGNPLEENSLNAPIIILIGPPGSGKATAVKTIARHHGFSIREWISPSERVGDSFFNFLSEGGAQGIEDTLRDATVDDELAKIESFSSTSPTSASKSRERKKKSEFDDFPSTMGLTNGMSVSSYNELGESASSSNKSTTRAEEILHGAAFSLTKPTMTAKSLIKGLTKGFRRSTGEGTHHGAAFSLIRPPSVNLPSNDMNSLLAHSQQESNAHHQEEEKSKEKPQKNILLLKDFPFGLAEFNLPRFQRELSERLENCLAENNEDFKIVLIGNESEDFAFRKIFRKRPERVLDASSNSGRDASSNVTFPPVHFVKFNPVAPTILQKAIKRILTLSGKTISSGMQQSLAQTGDLRQATLNLQFYCKDTLLLGVGCVVGTAKAAVKKVRGKSKKYFGRNDTTSSAGAVSCSTDDAGVNNTPSVGSTTLAREGPEPSKIDESINIFHALGKILYCKRQVPNGTPEERLQRYKAWKLEHDQMFWRLLKEETWEKRKAKRNSSDVIEESDFETGEIVPRKRSATTLASTSPAAGMGCPPGMSKFDSLNLNSNKRPTSQHGNGTAQPSFPKRRSATGVPSSDLGRSKAPQIKIAPIVDDICDDSDSDIEIIGDNLTDPKRRKLDTIAGSSQDSILCYSTSVGDNNTSSTQSLNILLHELPPSPQPRDFLSSLPKMPRTGCDPPTNNISNAVAKKVPNLPRQVQVSEYSIEVPSWSPGMPPMNGPLPTVSTPALSLRPDLYYDLGELTAVQEPRVFSEFLFTNAPKFMSDINDHANFCEDLAFSYARATEKVGHPIIDHEELEMICRSYLHWNLNPCKPESGMYQFRRSRLADVEREVQRAKTRRHFYQDDVSVLSQNQMGGFNPGLLPGVGHQQQMSGQNGVPTLDFGELSTYCYVDQMLRNTGGTHPILRNDTLHQIQMLAGRFEREDFPFDTHLETNFTSHIPDILTNGRIDYRSDGIKCTKATNNLAELEEIIEEFSD